MEVQTPATVYVASSEQLEGLILKAVRTIIPELAGYKKPAEEASDTLTAEEAIVFLQAMGYPTTLSNLYGFDNLEMRSPIVRCAGALCSLARSSQNGLRQALCVPRNSGRPQHCGSHSRQITSNNTRAMYEMKIAAGARSEHAAATPGVDTSKDTQKLSVPSAARL